MKAVLVIRRRRNVALLAVLALIVAGAAGAGVVISGHAGPQGDGTSITPVGWRVTPTGKQLQLGERPYGLAASPDGKTLLVSNNGIAVQSLMAVDAGAGRVAQTITYLAPKAVFLGVAFSPDGSRAYASA